MSGIHSQNISTHLTHTPFDDLLVQIKKCIYAYKSSSNTIVLIYCLQFHGFIKCFFLHFKMCFLSCLQDEIKTMECYVYTDFNFLHLSSFEPWMENKCVTCITWIQCYLKKVYEDLTLGSLY